MPANDEDDHYAEEQSMEAEALSAIFDTHFTMVQSNIWQVDIYPETTGDADALNHVACRCIVELPDHYPDVVPLIRIEIIRGLADEHVTLLQSLAETEAHANTGVPCIFAVAEKVREWLLENNIPGLDDISMHAQMMRKKYQQEKDAAKKQQAYEAQIQTEVMTEAEREELEVTKRRAEGTPCTKENFEKWQAAFLREMEQQKMAAANAEADEKTSKSKREKNASASAAANTKEEKSGRITGYAFFAGKMDNLEAFEAAAEQAAAAEEEEEEEELDVDEELFEDDVDLDELDFDDDDDEDDDDGEEDDDELDI